jgi:hypothetical protein
VSCPLAEARFTLASAIILPDHPEVAKESAGELYDGTEIDEILTLRTLALTDEEKDAARATDPRAAALIDRVESLDGGCGTASDVSDPIPVCPRCGSADVDVSGGDELTLESVSYSHAKLSRTDLW